MLRKEAELLNEKFMKFMKTGLPFVGVKLAQTLDGKIADINGDSKWITSQKARTSVHQLRSEYDAILIGANTVLKDNPELTVRFVKGRNPVRVVVDGRLSVPVSQKIFNVRNAPTWVLTSMPAMNSKNEKIRELASRGVRVLGVLSSLNMKPESILKTLSREGISSVLIEGGSQTIASFIKQIRIDKFYLFISPKILGGGLEAFHFEHPQLLKKAMKLNITGISTVGEDVLVEARL
jgi:diaminohydroxyphosphoribosylaminopyrimidine deaminase/5-amino-6-(5-phosphoribosylamino)uracil reductase